jgi:hypothetical protein
MIEQRDRRTCTDCNLNTIDDELTSIVDVDLLKSQLMRQRKQLSSTMNSIIQLELSYQYVVSRVDHDRLLHEHDRLENDYRRYQDEYQQLGHACLLLMSKARKLIDERNRYYDDWQLHRSHLTPRPDWDKVANVIDGGIQRWQVLSKGKSSEQLREILTREILDSNANCDQNQCVEFIDNDRTCFQALGNTIDVLSCLRVSKHISLVNRHMRRRMAGILIQEIWHV